MTQSLKQRLLEYLRRQDAWVHKGELQRLVASRTTYTPENAGRRLRELETEGRIEVMYERNTALYRAKKLEPLVAMKNLKLI